jgi:acetyl-CoA carboxylase biotin carboxyl carrier protein
MDIKQIKSLVQLMVENDLSRIELREADTHILLRRGYPPMVAAAPSTTPVVAAAAAIPAATAPLPAPATDEHVIRSPMVGTFYAAPDPETPPFVNVGSDIGSETVVCLIEAMKVFNEIKAEVAGRITKVLVKNAQAVEFDQPLFAVALA